MVTALSAKQTILGGDGQFGTLTHVCSFLDQPTVMCVSRAFRKAMRTELVEVGKQIVEHEKALAQRTVIPDVLIPKETRRAVLADLMAKTILNDPELEPLSRELNECLAEEEVNLYRAARLYHSLTQFEKGMRETQRVFFEMIPAYQGAVTQEEIASLFVSLNPASRRRILDLMRQATRMAMVEKMLAKHFQMVITNPPDPLRVLDPSSPLDISACLCRLQRNQMVLIQSIHDQRLDALSAKYGRGFPVERFIEQELLAQEAEEIRDKDYQIFWYGITEELQHLGVNIANPPTTPLEIRAWLNRAENAVHLQQIHSLSIFLLHHIPPEIGRLTNLRRLSCPSADLRGHLKALPQEMENLIHLEYLYLIYNAFETIPDVVRRLPNLRELILGSNRIRELPNFLTELPALRCLEVRGNPIEVLPDAIYRHFEESSLFFPNLTYLLKSCFSSCLGEQRQSVRIDLRNLRQLPFQLWFHNMIITNFSAFDRALSNWLEDYIGRIAATILCLPFMLPLMVLEWILLDIVVPLTTLFRDLLGYDRMVTVEPAQEN